MQTTSDTTTIDRGFTRVGESGIHGTGLFARRRIPKGTRIIEYLGRRRTISSILSMPGGVNRCLFHLHDGIVIDGAVDGNDARYINHSCEPNCEVYSFDERLYIYAMREIARGEELTFDYQLRSIADRPQGRTSGRREEYPCRCGSATCRRTLRTRRRRGV